MNKHYPFIIALLLLPLTAHAYIGSGIGLSAIGAFFTLGLALLTTVWGFIWQPLKQWRKKPEPAETEANEAPTENRENDE